MLKLTKSLEAPLPGLLTIFRPFIMVLLLVVITKATCAQGILAVKLTPQQLQDSLYVVEHYQVRKEMIPMRDGVKLYTEIIIPKNAAKTKKYPVLMTRTPYNATRLDNGLY